MIKPITTPGKTYAVTSPNGCTVTQRVGEVDIVTDVPAGVQTLIIAHASKFEIDDDSAIVTECGGSAELVFTAATTRRSSSGSGSDGMTAEERALLMGAAQRDADNTFTAANTFTGSVDMSAAQVTPPSGWNVEGGAELTAEAIQEVAPIAWGAYTKKPASAELGIALGNNALAKGYKDYSSVSIGVDAIASALGVAIGQSATSHNYGVAVGPSAKCTNMFGTAVGLGSEANLYSASFGRGAKTKKATSITIGIWFDETVNGSKVQHYCTTEAQGSITIGAGANTFGETSTNSVTMGCKAENKGADSVVLGAQAKATAGGTVAIGAGAEAADAGAVVFASYSTDRNYKTQLYFSGAGSALANTYANGEGIMGYVTTDAAGNVIASGYKKLSALFDEGSMTQPATLDEFGDWVMPKVFQPGTLPQQEYTPLPVYPVVEPEIEEMEGV